MSVGLGKSVKRDGHIGDGNSSYELLKVKGRPERAGRDDDPPCGWDRRRGTWLAGPSSCSRSLPVRIGVTPDARRPVCALEVVKRPFCRSFADVTESSSEVTGSSQRPAGVTSEAVETLRCARSGGPGPSAETAVTADRREANDRRCGGGVESGGWREVAEWCHATEGSGHE